MLFRAIILATAWQMAGVTPAAASWIFPPAETVGTAPTQAAAAPSTDSEEEAARPAGGSEYLHRSPEYAMPRPTAPPLPSSPSQSTPSTYPVTERRLFGYPAQVDPLWAHEVKPDYRRQHVEKPRLERPTYVPPSYQKPSYGLDAVHKPRYEMPLAILPSDNKPSNYTKYYAPPSIMNYHQAAPVYRDAGTNYVIKPYREPAVHRPDYDDPAVRYNRPEYRPPVYTPQEFKKPRELAPPYIAPPK